METSFSQKNLEADEIHEDNDDDQLMKQPSVITLEHIAAYGMKTKDSLKRVRSKVYKS